MGSLWCCMDSWNFVVIASGNGLALTWHRSITWSNVNQGLQLHWAKRQQGGDKMAAILQTTFFDTYSCISIIQISLYFVSKDPVNNKVALVQIMAWRRTGGSRQAIIWTIDGLVYWWIHVSLNLSELSLLVCRWNHELYKWWLTYVSVIFTNNLICFSSSLDM